MGGQCDKDCVDVANRGQSVSIHPGQAFSVIQDAQGQSVLQNINFQQLQRQLPTLGGMKDGQTLNIVQSLGGGSLNIQPMGGQTQIIQPITAGQILHPQLIQPIGGGQINQINFQSISGGQGLLTVQPVTMITGTVNPLNTQVLFSSK